MAVVPGWRGRFYEDFNIGDIYQHPVGRTVTETDNAWFSLLTMNTNMLHMNRDYSRRGEFGRMLMYSPLVVAIATGQSITDLTQNGMANLGWDEVRLTHPVFEGDTLWSESIILEKRESKSKPHAGIVTARTRTLNQDGIQVCSFKRTFFVYKRDHDPFKDVFPKSDTPIDPDVN